MSDFKPSINAIRELRDRTGQGLLSCKFLLIATQGDIEKAMALRHTFPEPTSKWFCPACGKEIENGEMCAHCPWVRLPSDRTRWGLAGHCPKCHFTYRWDGSSCSHCGHGVNRERIQAPVLVLVPPSPDAHTVEAATG